MGTTLLPIGTIVKIHNNDSKYVILGSLCKHDNKRYTYYCCKYPAGLIIDGGQINEKIKDYELYINSEEIERIVFLGNINSEG